MLGNVSQWSLCDDHELLWSICVHLVANRRGLLLVNLYNATEKLLLKKSYTTFFCFGDPKY